MDAIEVAEVQQWRVLDREAQGLANNQQLRAQVVIDIAEDCKAAAIQRGTDPLDDLLDLYLCVTREGAKKLIADAVRYLRAEAHLIPRTGLKAPTGTVRYLGRAIRQQG